MFNMQVKVFVKALLAYVICQVEFDQQALEVRKYHPLLHDLYFSFLAIYFDPWLEWNRPKLH
jgi:hypothetical protein